MTTPIIELQNINFHYQHEPILQDISFTVQEGEFWALIGPNGSGKSTLINIILGLLKPTSGTLRLFGEESRIFKERERIGYVSQKSNAFQTGFPATVLEVVRSGLTRKKGLFSRFTAADKEKTMEALDVVNMSAFANRNIGELSGGQQQRVFIARALVGNPDLLIMDEPTVGIDQQNAASFYIMLNELNRERGIAIVLVAHEVDVVTKLATHVACLNRTVHFHGIQSDYDKLSAEEISQWYGHPVRLIHQERTGEKI